VINKDNSGEVILSKDSRSWGSFWYDAKRDALRSKIKLRDGPHTEILTYDFNNLTKNGAELLLSWEKKQLPVKIEFDVDNIVMANATEELKGPAGFTWQGYASAADYAVQNKVNYEQALTWINRAVAQNNSFATLRIKGELLKQTGKVAEGEKIFDEAIKLASENELNAYGYQLLNDGNTEKAIEMLVLNTQRHPGSANAWDSLGEAYTTKGDKKNAVINFKKALGLNPSANVKANSEKFLKQLGAM
jgi:tetratricopeptide (TPR) repeat protein